MVVALVALLVALAGTSVAAVTALPNNSVGTAQLKNNAVTSAKLKGNAVTSAKIGNGQVKPADLSASAKTSGPPGPQGPTGPQGPQGPAGVASPGYVAQVASDTSTGSTTTNSTSFGDLPGADEAITVPTGETARLYVWFSAESNCTGGAGYCSARITVDGNEIEPAAGSDFAFDSLGDSYESHSMVRVSGTLAAGSHTVKVQGGTTSALTTFRIDDWAMVIERVRLS
jgi:hypothetical protein